MLLACPHMVDATACLGWGGVGWDDNVNSSRVFGVTVRELQFQTVDKSIFTSLERWKLGTLESLRRSLWRNLNPRKLRMQLTRGAPWCFFFSHVFSCLCVALHQAEKVWWIQDEHEAGLWWWWTPGRGYPGVSYWLCQQVCLFDSHAINAAVWMCFMGTPKAWRPPIPPGCFEQSQEPLPAGRPCLLRKILWTLKELLLEFPKKSHSSTCALVPEAPIQTFRLQSQQANLGSQCQPRQAWCAEGTHGQNWQLLEPCKEVSAFQPVDTVRQKQRSDAVAAVLAMTLWA